MAAGRPTAAAKNKQNLTGRRITKSLQDHTFRGQFSELPVRRRECAPASQLFTNPAYTSHRSAQFAYIRYRTVFRISNTGVPSEPTFLPCKVEAARILHTSVV